MLAGGFLAGLVINVGEGLVGALLFGEDLRRAMEAHNLQMEADPVTMALHLAMGFVLGIAAVWLYAAIRPRYGPGPKTAVRAAFAFWIVAYLLPMVGYWSFGLFPQNVALPWSLIGLVEIILATVLGAWLYKEA